MGALPSQTVHLFSPPTLNFSSLVAQIVKNLPTMQEIHVQSLGQEDPLENGTATHSSILAWKIPMDRGSWQESMESELDTTE